MSENDADEVAADPAGDLLEGRPVASPVAWLLSYQYPVHRIRPDFQPTEPHEQPTRSHRTILRIDSRLVHGLGP